MDTEIETLDVYDTYDDRNPDEWKLLRDDNRDIIDGCYHRRQLPNAD